MLDEVTAVLKEIGCEDKHYEKVAQILVGLELGDDDLLPVYIDFVEKLETHNKEKIYKTILDKQADTFDQLEGIGDLTGLSFDGKINGWGSCAAAQTNNREKKIESADRITTIHDAMFAASYLKFLGKQFENGDENTKVEEAPEID